MTRSEALKILTVIRAAWPQASFPQETVEVWADRLTRYDLAPAARAVERLVHTFDRPLSVFGVLAVEVFREQIGSTSGEAAWVRVRAVSDRQASVDGLHPVSRRALRDVGGLYAVRTSEHPHLLRREFVQRYEELLRDAHVAFVRGEDWRAALDPPGESVSSNILPRE